MSPAFPRRLAWSSWVVTLALVAAMCVLYLLALDVPMEGRQRPPLVFLPFIALMPLAFATVGALVASRRAENPIGWILCGVGVTGGISFGAQTYADWSLYADASAKPGGDVAVWLLTWTIVPFLTATTLFALLFPNGRLLSHRWRPVAWFAGAAGGVLAAAFAFDPGTMDEINYPGVRNPVGLERANGPLEVGITVGAVLALLALLLSVAAMAMRLARSTGVERQQLKWVVYAGAIAAAGFTAGFPLSSFGAVADAVFILAFLAFLGVPVAGGIAILRYRLYDIDVVINRTLVYGLLTAALAGTYLGLVLLLQLVSEPLTQGSDLAIAGSTLAVAALFRPLRARIQAIVDRRFYRRKYDATQTLAAFSARLRDEIDLDALRAELADLVRETVQPAHVSLWLRAHEK